MIHSLTALIALPTALPITDPDLMGKLALHAAAIAGIIRLVIMALRSPLLGLLWLKVPKPIRPLVILALGVLAAVFDNLALGTPLIDAIFSAIGGVSGAIASHEVQNRVMPKPAPPPPPVSPEA